MSFQRYVALGDSFTEGVGDPDPTRPNGVRGWADRVAEVLAEREPDFARGFTEALIAYALGRPFGFIDEDLANEILTDAKVKQYSVSEFVKTLVLSKAFRQK